MKHILGTTALATLALTAATSHAQQKPPSAKSASYWMSAETTSGMAVQDGSGLSHGLMLQLGSSSRAAGQPSAEHLPPAALKAGASLPLTTPRPAASGNRTGAGPTGQMGQGKGKMLLYWGCGEQARAGQPLIVDMASLGSGKASPLTAMLKISGMTPPSASRHATYGEWPNERGRTTVPTSGSLVGDHVVRGNYSPEMRFALTPANDFLAPLSPRSTKLSSGAVKLTWPAVANAKAYVANVTGAAADGSIVMWTSSDVKAIGAALSDYLAPAEIARLLQQKALMGPQATECTVPAEVARAAPASMLQMVAHGPEANFSSPPRAPEQWAAKMRSKSTHMAILGMNSPVAARAAGSPNPAAPTTAPGPQQPSLKRGLLKGLGGLLGSKLQ